MGAARLVSSQGFRLILGTGVSLLTLYLAFQKVSFPGLWQVLGVVNLNWVLLALVSVGANTISKVVRWKGLMGQPGDRIRWGQVFISFLAGSLLNWVYPARLGDFSRATIIGNQGPGTIFILGTITLEKILDTLFYVLLILLLLLIVPLPAWIQSSAQGFALASILLIFLLALAVLQRRDLEKILTWFAHQGPAWISAQVRARLAVSLRSGLSCLDVLQAGRRLGLVVCWSIAIWITSFLTTFLMMNSLPMPLVSWSKRLTASLLTLVTLQVGISLPSVPGRFGVFEAACVLALGTFGIEQTLASGFGLLLHTVILIPAVIAGVASLLILSQYRSSSGQS